MRVSYNWLKDYVDFDLSPEELAEALTMTGSEVDSVESLAPDVSGVITAYVEEVVPHPNADKLRVCRVNTGSEILSVVCGAPNVAAGQVVPLATVGARLPGDVKIGKAKLRGVESHGMICSERELGLSTEHKGIMVLPEGTPLGVPLAEALGLNDWVLDVDIYPNRPDNLSIIGIAREVAAIVGSKLRMPQPQIAETGSDIKEKVSLTVEAPDLCPRYSCRLIEGVKIGPSPKWLEQRLVAAGMRSINNVVDVTNFVMLELGQPLHAFDYDLLAGRRIVVRRARPNEVIVTLDGQTRALKEDMLVIADAEKAQVIAGVMGAESSEVTENTTNILLESANFRGPSIRRTTRELGLRSESSQRFEKGLDPNATELALDRAAALIAELAGGKIAKGVLDEYPQPVKPRVIDLRIEQVKRLLGIEIPPEDCVAYLERLELAAEQKGDTIRVEVPTFRGDITREADLVEEIARLYGYDKIPSSLPMSKGTPGGKVAPMELTDLVRDVLVGFGLNEVMTYTFGSPKTLDLAMAPADSPVRNVITIRNPLSEEWSVMRTFVTPHLLEVVERNQTRQQGDVHIFELGSVYRPRQIPLTEGAEEARVLAIAMTGSWPLAAWGRKSQPVDIYDLKGILEELAAALGLEFTWKQAESSPHCALHPGRMAEVYCQGEKIGVLGELHPQVAENYSILGRVVVAEIELDSLVDKVNLVRRVRPLPKFPSVERDLALLVPVDVAGEQVASVMQECGEGILQSIRLFDLYEGAQIPNGYRSLAYTLSFQAMDRTLRDEEIQAVIDAIEKKLESSLRVQVRK